MPIRLSAAAAASCLTLASLLATGAAARPLTPSEWRYEPFDSELPGCADRDPLSEIRTSFHAREAEFWRTGLDIVSFEEVRETGFRANGLDYIPRRYCWARVAMSDSKIREVSYSISKGLGEIGFGFGVEWCVTGLDRFDANSPNCKMVRP